MNVPARWASTDAQVPAMTSDPRPTARRDLQRIWCHRSCVAPALPSRDLVRNPHSRPRSEEHTSELQSLTNLVCRLLLEKKKTHNRTTVTAKSGMISIASNKSKMTFASGTYGMKNGRSHSVPTRMHYKE